MLYSVVSISLSVCNACIVAKRCVLRKSCLKKQIGYGLRWIEWSRDRWRHIILKVMVKSSWRCYLASIANYQIVCYEAVLSSAIPARACLLVKNVMVKVEEFKIQLCFTLCSVSWYFCFNKIINNSGLRILPCGIPRILEIYDENLLLIVIFIFLLNRQSISN